MSLSRKSFLRLLGGGAAGLGLGRVWAAAPAEMWPELPAFGGALDADFWAAVRGAYRIEPGFHYLNSGGLGPSVESVRSAVSAMKAQLARRVESGHDHFASARDVAAPFLGCAAEEIAFVRNATEANGIIAGGLQLEPGDEVIFESHAHPGGSFPWLLQAQRRGVAVRLFEPDPESVEGNLERIRELMTSRTRVVQVSHVTAPTGILMPVADIARLCQERGIWFHVDGAQSAGMFPFSLHEIGCDSYATSGHKWLGAPHETGILMVKRTRLDEVTPSMVGAYSGEVESLPGALNFYPGAARFEYGTRDVSKVVGLTGAIHWQERVGRERIGLHGRALVERLRAALQTVSDLEILTPAEGPLAASMLTFRSPRLNYRELFGRLLNQHQMRCRPVSEQGLDAVRVSCHLFNHAAEIDQLADAIRTELSAA